MSEYYVYILYREDGETPFYVGYGKGNRWSQHEKGWRRFDNHKNRIIARFKARGDTVPKCKIAESLTKLEAVALEIETIAKLGREPHGPLTNATPGGDGVREWTPEMKAQISAKVSASLQGNSRRKGIPHTREMRDHLAEVLSRTPRNGNPAIAKYAGNRAGKPMSDAHKAAIAAAHKARVANGTHHLLQAGRTHSEDVKTKIRETNLKRLQDPEVRKRMSEARKGIKFSDEQLANMRAAQQRRWARARSEKEEQANGQG